MGKAWCGGSGSSKQPLDSGAVPGEAHRGVASTEDCFAHTVRSHGRLLREGWHDLAAFCKSHSGCFERRGRAGRQEGNAKTNCTALANFRESIDASLGYGDSGGGGEKPWPSSQSVQKVERMGFRMLWMWLVRERQGGGNA